MFPAPETESDNSRLVRVDVYRGDEIIEDFKDSEQEYEELMQRIEGSQQITSSSESFSVDMQLVEDLSLY